jgi:pyridoxal phosphate enzyme (YggS family)
MHEHPTATEIAALRARVEAVRAEIAAAAARAGRRAEEITLVGVSKLQPAPVLAAAAEAGLSELGENYVQEAAEKFAALGWPPAPGGAPVVRRCIGALQANKVRKALTWFDTIDTLDSVALAQRVNRIAAELGRTVRVLLEINISNEPQKSGFLAQNLEGVLLQLANQSSIRIEGLMTIGRFEPDPEAARADFRALRALRDRLQAVAPPSVSLHALSMGMSHDFPVAIEEGATLVRVGTRLFGPRHTP